MAGSETHLAKPLKAQAVASGNNADHGEHIKKTRAISKVQPVATQHIFLIVTQVQTVAEYAAVMAYLKNIVGITEVNMLRTQPGIVTFELSLSGDSSYLEKTLEADDKMRRVVSEGKATLDHNGQLIYEWSP